MDGNAKINIAKEKLFSRKPPALMYQLGFMRSNYFLALFCHMEMLIGMNINFFEFE